MLLIAAALTLMVQDPPPGEIVVTAPAPARAAAALPDPYAGHPAAPPERSSVDPSVLAYGDTGRDRQVAAPLSAPSGGLRSPGEIAPGSIPGPSTRPDSPFDQAFAESRASGAPRAADSRSEPLPAEALSDPVRYAARQCRPEVRPASEGVAECFDRVDRAVREEQDRRAAARRPRTTCTRDETRDEDGRTSSTSGRCVIGTGDPAELERVLGW